MSNGKLLGWGDAICGVGVLGGGGVQAGGGWPSQVEIHEGYEWLAGVKLCVYMVKSIEDETTIIGSTTAKQ